MEKKDVNIKYHRLKNQRKEKNRDFSLREPVRRMLFDRVLENLKMFERVTYIHRIIYVGEHNVAPDLPTMLANTVNGGNDSGPTEKLTGFLLVYQKFFLHMVEGCEDTINKYVGDLLRKYGNSKEVQNMTLLIQVSHVLKRLCPEWMTYYGVPPKLLTSLEEGASMEETGRRLYTCLRQIYTLVETFVRYKSKKGEAESYKSKESESLSSLSQREGSSRMSFLESNRSLGRKPSVASSISRSTFSNLSHVKDRYWQHLPEIELIDALIRSPFTQSMHSFYDKYMYVPQRDIYKDKVWPVPGDFIPFDVFAAPYECVTELRGHMDMRKDEQDEHIEETEDAAHSESED